MDLGEAADTARGSRLEVGVIADPFKALIGRDDLSVLTSVDRELRTDAVIGLPLCPLADFGAADFCLRGRGGTTSANSSAKSFSRGLITIACPFVSRGLFMP